MVRSRVGLGAAPTSEIFRSLLPFIVVQLAVTACVFALPPVLHLLDAPKAAASGEPLKSEEDIIRQMREMSGSPPSDVGK